MLFVFNLTLNQLDKVDRRLQASFQFKEADVRPALVLEITFPSAYPHTAPPAFIIVENNTGNSSPAVKQGHPLTPIPAHPFLRGG